MGQREETKSSLASSNSSPHPSSHRSAPVPSSSCPESYSSTYHDICSICLSSYENPVTLVSCHHSYCLSCLLLWLVKKQLCPLCKSCGNYFVQTNRYSSSSGRDVKVLSISSTTQKLSSSKVSRAIEIHRRRFPSHKKTLSHPQSAKDKAKKHMRASEILRDKRAHRRSGDDALGKRHGRSESRTDTGVGQTRSGKGILSEEERVSRELKQISSELNETVGRLYELDQKISALSSQKKRKVTQSTCD
jgi:hypothetical protein